MKFDINNYKGKYVMHCKTKEEARSFCDYLYENGKTWVGGQSYQDRTYWDCYKETTAYNFNDGGYSPVSYYTRENYTILEWSDFTNEPFTKADLKTGDVILRRDGDIEIVIKEFESFLRSDSGYNSFDGITDDLTSIHSTSRDIVAIRRPRYDSDCVFSAFEWEYGTLIYDREREETEEMTLAEVCKLLGKNIKIIQ